MVRAGPNNAGRWRAAEGIRHQAERRSGRPLQQPVVRRTVFMCNHNHVESLAALKAVRESSCRMQPNTAQNVVPAIPSVAQYPRTAISTLRRASLGMPGSLRGLLCRDSSRHRLNRMRRLSSRLQDALDDTRTELADAVALAPATSSFARAVSEWPANSRWLRLGSAPPNRAKHQRLT